MKNNTRSYKGLMILIAIVITISGCTTIPTKVEDQNNQASLSMLNIPVPTDWKLDKSEKMIWSILDDIGESRGAVSAIPFKKNFDLLALMPNHSEVINEEFISLPLGEARLITLDSDNGTAASGITGTHDTYYAAIPVEDIKTIFILNFTNNDKSPDTKKQFIELLEKLSLNSQ